MRRSSQALRIVFHTPIDDSPHLYSRNIPDRKQAAGEVSEQRILARVIYSCAKCPDKRESSVQCCMA